MAESDKTGPKKSPHLSCSKIAFVKQCSHAIQLLCRISRGMATAEVGLGNWQGPIKRGALASEPGREDMFPKVP